MTNNTIPNVPRELLERLALQRKQDGWLEMNTAAAFAAAKELRVLLDATPSPAGVDGCKCSMSISMLGDGCRHCQPQEYIDRLGEILDEERSELSDAQAIIEGLRGEVERSDRARMNQFETITKMQAERCKLDGLLREALHEMCNTSAPRNSFTNTVDRIDAALSAGKEGE